MKGHTVRVLSDVEFAKDHYRFFSQVAAVGLVPWVFRMDDPNKWVRRTKKRRRWGPRVRFIYPQDASASSKLPVLAPVVDFADP